jgi:Asp-tRNA(Asn)/Glu-tRNA(Gln) amidotransferase A subunit family amidase
MPVAVHLIGAHGEDATLARVARWVMGCMTRQPLAR